MATNPYFRFYSQIGHPEQQLMQELITESIRMYGADCYYLPRETWSEVDYIFGEDASSKFSQAYRMEMYIETGNSLDGRFDGMNDYFSKFGIEIRDDVNTVVSRQTFERYVPGNVRNHPREGDLIYIPTFDKIFEIKFVEQDVNFFSIGKKNPYVFQLRCESFRYSHESIDTDIEDIDNIELENSYTVRITLDDGDGDYYIGEQVYVGANLSSASQTANVAGWFTGNSTITLVDIKGQFNTGNVVGVSSGTSRAISTVDELGDHSVYDFYDNKRFEDSANTFLDKITEVNPLGTS